MAAAAPSLNGGPPLPPNLQPAPQASMGQLAGQGGAAQNPEQPGGSASLQQAVIQKAMFIEATMNDIGTIMPAAAAGMGGIINQFRKVLGAALSAGATPPAAQAPPTGSMLMAGGGFGNAPSS